MAPRSAVLKRKRSQPGEWWVASPSIATETPEKRDGPPAKKRGRPSISGKGRTIQEAPAAGNRRKRRDSMAHEGGENVENREAAKPLRPGRSSNTEAEVMAASELAAEVESANRKKAGRPAKRAGKNDGKVETEFRGGAAAADAYMLKKKRGRPAATRQKDRLVGDPAEDQIVPLGQGVPNAAQVEEQGNPEIQNTGQAGTRRGRGSTSRMTASGILDDNQATKASKSVQHERSSNTLNGLQAAAQIAAIPQPEAEKYGRPAKNREEAYTTVEVPSADNETIKPLRRGRSSQTEEEIQAVAELSSTEDNSQKKHGMAARTEDENKLEFLSVAKGAVRRNRTRQSDADTLRPTAAISPTQDLDRLKRRARPMNTKKDEPVAPGSVYKSGVGQNSHGRESGTVVEIEIATSSLARNRNVPKKRDNISKTTSSKASGGSSTTQGPSKSSQRSQKSTTANQKDTASQRPKKKSKASSNMGPKSKSKQVEELDEHPPRSKLHPVEEKSRQEPVPQTEKAPDYQHLAAITRRVTLQTIREKWRPLPTVCVEKISQLVHDAQRPVIVHLNDGRRRTEANTALNMVSRKLLNKLSQGVPFPPTIRNQREDEFDFEKILDHNRVLEARLTPALHANELLEAELAKETEYLESDQEALVKLEANAKSELVKRKEAGRKLHSLLRLDSMITEDDQNDNIGLGDIFRSVLPFSHSEDESLQEIAKELNGHLDSIEGNLRMVQGISQAMANGRAAVQATLFDHLESNQYEEIVLG